MAPHSSTLAWKIPWMEEPGGLQSMGSHRVRHDRSDLAAAAATLQRKKLYTFTYFMDNKYIVLSEYRLDGSLHGIFLISGILYIFFPSQF